MKIDKQDDFKHLTFAKGKTLIKEGETGNAAYLILSGEVEVRKGAHGSNPRTVATLGKGHVIGEMSLFDGRPHAATIVALEDTEVSAMSRDEFLRMLEAMDPVMKGIVGMMVGRLRQAMDELIPDSGNVNWSDWK